MAVEVQYRGDNDDTGPSDGVWFDVDPLASPKKSIDIFEDFVGSAVMTQTAVADAGGRGGIVALADASDAVTSALAFAYADDKDLTFECRLTSVDAVTALSARIGFENTAASFRIGFEVAGASAVLKHDDDVNDETIGTITLPAAGTYAKLGIRVRGAGSNAEIVGYLDGVEKISKKVSAFDVDGTPSTVIHSTAMAAIVINLSASGDFNLDWIRAGQLR